jgi:hypothetical protein
VEARRSRFADRDAWTSAACLWREYKRGLLQSLALIGHEPFRHSIPVHGLSNANFLFIINYIHNFANLPFDNLMLLFNREGSFHTESAPMES